MYVPTIQAVKRCVGSVISFDRWT